MTELCDFVRGRSPGLRGHSKPLCGQRRAAYGVKGGIAYESRKISTSRPQQSPDLRNVKCDPSRNWVSSGLRDAANRRNVDILKSRVQVKKNGRVLLTFKVPK